jgi:carbon storage regulator
MLILTRNPGECIKIGEHITIKIIHVKDRCVHLGIDAPKEIQVHREEVYQQIKKGIKQKPKKGDQNYGN